MTLPDERFRALKAGKKLIEDLVDRNITPRVPKHIRQQALSVLRHYPNDYQLDAIADESPGLLNRFPWK